MDKIVFETDFPDLKLIKQGKVRDIYDLGEHLLMVTTDRVSAFDVILPDPVPYKGIILTQISLFWYKIMEGLTKNHLVSCEVDDYPSVCKQYKDDLNKRSMLVKKTEPLPVECVVRGYISGSGWKSYKKNREVCGIKLSRGLVESDKLVSPIFTPSTKEEVGIHDVNIDFTETVKRIGEKNANQVKDLSISIYNKGVEIADRQGIIIADTKFEFGIKDGEIILIDEVLTPDSSRFWPKSSYEPGRAQNSFDKQYIRDYLVSVNWDKTSPGPKLPRDVIDNTVDKYKEALRVITGGENVI